MHELQVTQSILDTVLRAARESGLARVCLIRLQIGALNELRQEWIQHYFDYLSEGTAAAGARIAVRTVPPLFRCRGCGCEFPLQSSAVETVCCPACAGDDLLLTGGRDFLIQDMEGQ